MLHSSLRLHQFVANQRPKPHSILGNLNQLRDSYLTSYITFDYYAADRVHRNPNADFDAASYLLSQILQTDAAEHARIQWCFNQGLLQLPLPIDIADSTSFRLEARSILYYHALTNHPKSGQSVLSMPDQYTNYHVGN